METTTTTPMIHHDEPLESRHHSSIENKEIISMTSTPSERSTDESSASCQSSDQDCGSDQSSLLLSSSSSVHNNETITTMNMKHHPDEESSPSDYNNNIETSMSSYVEDFDLGEDCNEEPSNATTHRAVYTEPRRRQRPVQPRTPEERYCCRADEIDYDIDDQPVWEGGSCLIRLLRYCRLMPPRPNEHVIKRRIRFLLWWTMLLDLAVAVVALTCFGTVLTCCQEPILDLPQQTISILLDAYFGVVLLQIFFVVREGCIPFNLVNPIFGLACGFVLFWNDVPMAALCIWILQIVSVALEFVTYRQYSILWKEAKRRLEQSQQGKRPRRSYQQSQQDRVLRELRRRHSKSLNRLRKHMIGVFINVLLVIATLVLIVYVAKRGGMCVKDGGTPSLFVWNDEMECNKGARYETCDLDSGESECYFPFF